MCSTFETELSVTLNYYIMSNTTIPNNPSNTLTLKGLTTKQKDGLIAGGLTLGAIITGVGFYQLFGKSSMSSSGVGTDGVELTSDNTESIVESVEDANSEELLDTASNLDSSLAESSVTFTFNSEVNISNSVSDSMEFDDAFLAARQDVGAGGFFNYRGNSYSTFHKEEWEGMSAENQNEYLTKVEEQSIATPYETSSSVYVEPVMEDAVVENYEIVEEVETPSIDNTVADDSSFESDDFFGGLEEEVSTDETNSVSDDILDDDFFSDIDQDDTLTNTANEEVNDTELTTMEDDDFFSDIDQADEEAMDTESTTMEDDDFFSDLNDINEEDGISEAGGADNVVIVRPVYGMDQDGDDVIDMIAIDANEDGIADVIALDSDNDGDYESFMINQHGGDNLDVFIVDEGNNGIDAGDATESIDNVVSMEDFIVLDDDQVADIEDLELIESLIDGTDIIIEEDSTEDFEDNDFDEIGL